MIKLIAFDIDDTITTEARTVPKPNIDAVKRAQDAGIFVTLATGRGFHGSSYIWQALDIKGPIINYGGAVVNDTVTGKPLYTTELDPRMVKELFALAKELNVHAHLYQGDSIVFEKENKYSEAYSQKLGLPTIVDPEVGEKTWHNVPKVLYITEPERADELISALGRRYDGKLKVSGSVPGYVEFNAENAHKGSALKWVADYLGIERGETAAVGDNLLDLEMIQYAGIGAAVAGANPEILSAANVVLPRCEDMAAAWFIDNIILKGREQQ